MWAFRSQVFGVCGVCRGVQGVFGGEGVFGGVELWPFFWLPHFLDVFTQKEIFGMFGASPRV